MIMQLEKRRELLSGLLVASLAFLVYANSLGNGFALDDAAVILNNPALQGSPIDLLSSIDTTSETQLLPFYRPLTYLTFYIEGRVHAFNPFLIRLFNVLLHAVNVYFAYRLARVLMKDTYSALLVGLLFAVHPLHTEAVDFNAGGRNTMLACFFVLTAYLLHYKSVLQNSYPKAIGAALLFMAGLFSKELALFVLPFIVVLEIKDFRARHETSTGAWLRTFYRLLPYLTAALCYLLMRWLALSRLGIQTGLLPSSSSPLLHSLYLIPSLADRLLDNLYIIPRYVLTILWPTALSSRYMVPEDLNLVALPLVAAWLCIICVVAWVLTRGRSQISLFGLSWFVLFWLPVSGIGYVPGAPIADRFLYIPAIGIWFLAADLTHRLFPDGPIARKYALAAIVIVLAALAVLTVRRNLDWRSNITLYTRFVEQYPDNAYGHAGLGTAYFVASRRDGSFGEPAERELEKALELSPTPAAFPAVHRLLGQLKLDHGEYEKALYHYNNALAIFPSDAEARLNRGITFEKLGRYKEALTDYQLYLSAPGNTVLSFRLYAETRIRELSLR